MKPEARLVRIAYFCEDEAHEQFLRGLLFRAAELAGGVQLEWLRAEVAGGSKVWGLLKAYARELSKTPSEPPLPDLLVVLLDSDCKASTVRERLREILGGLENKGISIVKGIASPHVEAWYLRDAKALAKAILGEGETPPPEALRVFRGLLPLPEELDCQASYKGQLLKLLSDLGIESFTRGVEYGEAVAREIAPVRMGPELRAFWEGLRKAFFA